MLLYPVPLLSYQFTARINFKSTHIIEPLSARIDIALLFHSLQARTSSKRTGSRAIFQLC